MVGRKRKLPVNYYPENYDTSSSESEYEVPLSVPLNKKLRINYETDASILQDLDDLAEDPDGFDIPIPIHEDGESPVEEELIHFEEGDHIPFVDDDIIMQDDGGIIQLDALDVEDGEPLAAAAAAAAERVEDDNLGAIQVEPFTDPESEHEAQRKNFFF